MFSTMEIKTFVLYLKAKWNIHKSIIVFFSRTFPARNIQNHNKVKVKSINENLKLTLKESASLSPNLFLSNCN